MKGEKLRVKSILELEQQLNQIEFHGNGIGSIMAVYWGNVLMDILDKRVLRHLIVVIYFHLKAIKPKPKFKDLNKKVLYFKSGVLNHHQRLEEAVISDDFLKNQTLVICPKDDNLEKKNDVFNSNTLKDLLNVWLFLFSNRFNFFLILKKFKIKNIERISLLLILFIQLLKVRSVKNFFISQKSTRIIAGDYDRGPHTAVWFTVAKAMGFKSFTLQHGVINPPYGYNPLIADEIWVWGKMAQQQLISLGVKEAAIKIVGTPILNKIEISKKQRQLVLEKLNLKKGRTIILALSTPNIINDRILVSFFAEIQKKYEKPEDNFLVKLHPARKAEDFKWVTEDFGLRLLPSPMDQSEFMSVADILLAHTSGIATEAVHYGIVVGILDILTESLGNGLEIHKYFGIPLIKEINDFEILGTQESVETENKIYFAIGDNAKTNIEKLLHEKLHS